MPPHDAQTFMRPLLAAEAADTIVAFFYSVHQQERAPAQLATRAQYRDPEFDAYVDDQYPTVQIFDEDFAASKILFELAPEPYRLYLDEYRFDQQSDSESEQGEQTAVDASALREEQS